MAQTMVNFRMDEDLKKKMENEEQRSYAKVIRPRGKVVIRESIAEPG